MGNRWAALGGAVLVALLAIGAWRIAATGSGPDASAPATAANGQEPAGSDPPAAAEGTGPTPTGTPSPTPPQTPLRAPRTPTSPRPSPGDTPAATGSPGEVAPPTPSPATAPAGGAALAGNARRSDAAGDLSDSAGRPPPEPQPAADLTQVELSGDGEELVVAFELAGDVPPRANSLVWSLDVWLDGDLAYTVTAQLIGSRLVAGVLDWDAGEQVAPPEPASVSGRSVSIRVPGDLLPRIDGPFQWQALAQADGGYEDYVPADGILAWFPDPTP